MRLNPIKMILPLFLLAGGPIHATAADLEAGEQLHNENCVDCHGNKMGGIPSQMYTRDNRRIHDLSGLRQMVQFCETSLELQWFDEDVDNVAAYLNKHFYHLAK